MRRRYEALIPAMQNNEGDRHVAAAAVCAGAQLIVSENVKHFRNLQHGLEVKTANDFLCDLLELSPSLMAELITDQASSMKSPPRTLEDVLRGLAKFAPSFVESLKPHL